jgi:RNA polymerase sigma factor (sigma-70 family)
MLRNKSFEALKKTLGNVTFFDKSTQKALFSRYQNGDEDSGAELIKSCIPLVLKKAKNYSDNNLEYMDLVQAGNCGLIKALQKFNPDKDTLFSTYAYKYIIGEFLKCIDREHRNTAIKRKIYKEIFGTHEIENKQSNGWDENPGDSKQLEQKQQFFWKMVSGRKEETIPLSPLKIALGKDLIEKFQRSNGKDKFFFVMKYYSGNLNKQELIELHKRMFPNRSNTWNNIRQFVKSTIDKFIEFTENQ